MQTIYDLYWFLVSCFLRKLHVIYHHAGLFLIETSVCVLAQHGVT